MEIHTQKNRAILWSPLKSIRPANMDDPRDILIISDPLDAKRYAVDRETFLNALVNEKMGNDDVERHSKQLNKIRSGNGGMRAHKESYGHWWKRGWHPSLEYYMWSRNTNYYDVEDSTGEKRRETIKRYINDEDPPKRIQPRGRAIPLPQPRKPSYDGDTLGKLLMERRTMRKFKNQPVSLNTLSDFLWYGLDLVRRTRNASNKDLLGYLLSYGVAYDFYIVLYSVADLDPGVYYYDLSEHELIQVKEGRYREQMVKYIFDQPSPLTANWTMLLVADVDQYQWRYRHERALRNLYIEAGRISQHLLLTGMVHKLGTLCTPAILDSGISNLLHLDRIRQYAVYSLTMGLYLGGKRSEADGS